MSAKLIPHRYLWIFLTFLLFACGPVPTEKSVIPTATQSPTLMPLPLFPTAFPKQKIELTPTSTKIPLTNEPFSPDKLRMVYVEDGNIFVRNGFNPPIQLTVSGIDQNPIISDDGEKIAFYRGDGFDTVFTINADGSQEQATIKSELPPILAQGKLNALTFVPDTHLLLFNTFLCNPEKGL